MLADTNNRLGWNDEDTYWRTNYRNRPYASTAGRAYEYYQPGYRYGYEAANRYQNRSWNDVESDNVGAGEGRGSRRLGPHHRQPSGRHAIAPGGLRKPDGFRSHGLASPPAVH